MANQIMLITPSLFESRTISSALSYNGYAVVSETTEMSRAMQKMNSIKFDALVIELQGRKELEFARNARGINCQMGIIFISPIHDLRLFDLTFEELPPGSQIIYKPNIANFEIIIESIIESRKSDAATRWINLPDIDKTEKLTDLQVETLRMVVSGFTNKEISKQEFVSEKAVEQRIGRLANVLGITFSNGQNLRVKLTAQFVNWTNGRK